MINEVTGFGTSRDKTAFSRFTSFRTLGSQELSDLYHGDAMAARIADTIPEECMRKGFEVVTGDDDTDGWLAEKHRDLNTRGKALDADRWAGVYGGAVLMIGANDGSPPWAPLDITRVRDVRYLYVVDCRYIQPLSYYEKYGHPKMGQPETYMVSAGNGVTVSSADVVHESRLIRFDGAPTGDIERAQLGGWDHSVLQRPHEVLLQFNTGWKAVEHMLTDANQAVFKMSGLAEALGPDGEATLSARIAAVDKFRSVMRAIVVDAGEGGADGLPAEEFTRQSVSFADIPATLDKLMLRLAGSVPMPVTFLMGQSPAGLSATGDSDFRWFYDRIDSRRNNKIAPRLRTLSEILLASKENPRRGSQPEKLEVKFDALWTLDPLQEAQRRQALASADAAWSTAGVYLPEEIALSRSSQDGFKEDIELTPEMRTVREERLKDGESLLNELEETEEPPDGSQETEETEEDPPFPPAD